VVPVFLSFELSPASTVTQQAVNSKPSKSARKREVQALQELGEQLIALSREQLESIDLDPRLSEAVAAAQSMRAHGALRRQKQLIGKLMRSVDPEPIRSALDRFASNDRKARQLFRDAERWRDRLAAEGDAALSDFSASLGRSSPDVDDAVKALRTAHSDRASTEARRRLFRAIHAELSAEIEKAPLSR
jgi:ribosome-associated protein